MKVGPYWRPHLTGCRTGVGAKARGLRRKNSETLKYQIRNTNVSHETETCTSVSILTQSRSNLTICKLNAVPGAVRTIEKQHISTKCVNLLYCTSGYGTVTERNTDLGTLTTIYWLWSGRSAKIEIHLCLLPHLFVVTLNGHANSRWAVSL